MLLGNSLVFHDPSLKICLAGQEQRLVWGQLFPTIRARPCESRVIQAGCCEEVLCSALCDVRPLPYHFCWFFPQPCTHVQLPCTHVQSVLKGHLHSSPALSCAALSSPLLCPANSHGLGLPDPQLHLFNPWNWPSSSGFPSLSSDLGTFLGQLAGAAVGLTSLAACVS